LRNVERHSGASTVTVRLAFAPHRLRLTISDDGAGLRPIPTASQLLGADHMGLIGMQERARLVGAELTLVSPSRGGLTVQVEAPFET
jgi:two-component system sensor histidine kinase DegS